MKRINVLCTAVLGLVVVLSGCGASKSPRLVNWYGSYAVDEEMQLKVTTLGMSQIQYELRHRPSDRVIIKSSGSYVFDRSAESAVRKARRFVVPKDPALFEKHFRRFTLLFKPDDLLF